MSTVRNELSSSQRRNYSFASLNEELSFSNINIPKKKPPAHEQSPPKAHKYARQAREYEMNRETIVPNQPPYSALPPIIIDTIHSVEVLSEENRRLEEVIFYLGNNNDKLIIDCDEKQKEIAFLKICTQKFKEQSEAQIRKLKEMLNDKASECESLAKNARREKESFQQETERLKFSLKSVIEKKNDELFNISRQRDRESHSIRKELQGSIEEMQVAQKKETEQNAKVISRLNEELTYFKQKYEKANEEYHRLDGEFQKEKLKIFEENQANLSQLKQKYYRNKLLLIETSQGQVRILEESSQLQRDVFLTQLEKMREQIQRVLQENSQLTQIGIQNNQYHEQNLKKQEGLIEELKHKVQSIYRTKQQQIETLKIKIGILHHQNLKAVQSTYVVRINHLQDRVKSLSSQVQRLENVLKRQLQKNNDLALKLRKKEAQIQEELAKIKLMHSNAEEALRIKFQTQKSMIMQHSAQMIKSYQTKANNVQFYEQELRKLRSNLADKTKECDQQQEQFKQRTLQWQRQREELTKHTRALNQALEATNAEIQRRIEQKSKQIERLNEKILKVIRESPLPDYSHFQQEIEDLKKRLNEKTDSEKNWKEKLDFAEKKCREYREQFQKLHLEGDVVINEAKAEWQSIAQQKLAELHEFYNKKQSLLQSEKDQLKNIRDQLQNKITRLVVQYKQLQNTLYEAMSSLKKRSEFDQKVILLGLDTNLVKNKRQLFEQ